MLKSFAKTTVLLTLLLTSNIALALQPVISSYLVRGLSEASMQRIANEFEVSRSNANAFEVIVPVSRRSQFLKLAPSARLIEPDISTEVRKVFSQARAFGQTQGYHSFSEIEVLLKEMATTYPHLTQLVTYGKSKLGKPLMALRVSGQLKRSRALPRVVLTAATHGDEIITTEILLNLMKTIVTKASSDPRLQAILKNVEVAFIPVVNPDGFSEQNRYDNGDDPNRSYPYPDKPTAVPTASIQGLIAFTQAYPIVGSIDFHAFGRLIMYPWAYTRQPVDPNAQKIFDQVTGAMAATNGYTFGQISKVIYVAKGSSADFFFWKYRSVSLGIEVGDSKSPNPRDFPKYMKDQEESTLLFLENFKMSRR